MERTTATTFRVGEWCVNPIAGEISRDGETARVEVRTMRLVVCLAEHAGEVVSIDDLLTEVWPDVTVTPDSVYQAVTSLRRLLGDEPKQPTYIATVPRLGYRMVAPVSLSPDPLRSEPIAQRVTPQALKNDHRGNIKAVEWTSPRSAAFKWAVGGALALLVAFWLRCSFAAGDEQRPAP
jgi:DNA-binding winged helix-turn-helix (wHTH) protein